MLVLSRRVGERVRIRAPDGTLLWIMLVDVDPRKARVGIEAPRDWDVRREELLPPGERAPAAP